LCHLWALHVVIKRQFFTFIVDNSEKALSLLNYKLIMLTLKRRISCFKTEICDVSGVAKVETA